MCVPEKAKNGIIMRKSSSGVLAVRPWIDVPNEQGSASARHQKQAEAE